MTPELLAQLAAVVGADDLLSDPADCWPYGYDNSRRHRPPEAVAFPCTHSEVAELVRLCDRHRIALVPRGLGSGTTGAAVPTHGGLVLSLERMNRIIAVDPDNRVMQVEPGVINQAAQDAAARHGFFWGPDPTSAAFCTIGGNLAFNSAGPRSVKYGTPRENVLGLRAVIGTGEEIRTGVYTTKGVVGYDLTRLIIGSEGTLAVITEATLKLLPLPQDKWTLRAVYGDIRAATAAIARLMAQPLTPCALEFIDAPSLEMVRAYSRADLPAGAGAMLIIEIDGPRAAMEEARAAVETAARVPGLLEFRAAHSAEEAAALWATRKALSPALRNVAPKKINEDVVVPVSRLPELIIGLAEISRQSGVTIVNFGHAGNGNIHVNLLMDPEDPEQTARAARCLDQVFDLVLRLRGTISGEHGIGLEKRRFIGREIEPATLALMQRIKAQFDPRGILNPGKIFPQDAPEGGERRVI